MPHTAVEFRLMLVAVKIILRLYHLFNLCVPNNVLNSLNLFSLFLYQYNFFKYHKSVNMPHSIRKT